MKQLLFILTTAADGAVPVQFRTADGNTNDSITHIQTWNALQAIAGRADFLYVADSKLCSRGNLDYIHRAGGRFVTVLPRSRQEDRHFRKWIQANTPAWELVWDRPDPRGRDGPRDQWSVYCDPVGSMEAWPIVWVWSTLLTQHQRSRRQRRITAAVEALTALRSRILAPRARLRAARHIEVEVEKILDHYRVRRYVRDWPRCRCIPRNAPASGRPPNRSYGCSVTPNATCSRVPTVPCRPSNPSSPRANGSCSTCSASR